MTNPTAKESYESAILQQLIKNSEDIAILKQDVAQIKDSVNSAKWLLITIAIGVLINLVSPPFVTFFYK